MAIVWIGLGTNLGDRERNLARALHLLRVAGVIEAVSSVYQSEPVGFKEQPDFWNLVVRVRTRLSADRLLEVAQEIEREIGREPSFRNGPRLIDIDLLLYDQDLITTPTLVIPHPRLAQRAFVLRPLVELNAELRHPVTAELLREILVEELLERAEPRFPGARLLEPVPNGSL